MSKLSKQYSNSIKGNHIKQIRKPINKDMNNLNKSIVIIVEREQTIKLVSLLPLKKTKHQRLGKNKLLKICRVPGKNRIAFTKSMWVY